MGKKRKAFRATQTRVGAGGATMSDVAPNNSVGSGAARVGKLCPNPETVTFGDRKEVS